MTEKEKRDYSWLWWIVIIAAFWLWGQISKANEPRPTPTPVAPTSAIKIDQDCLDDAMNDVPDEFSRCNDNPVEMEPLSDPIDPYEEGCPDGCEFHIDGCDIKGNISFDSGEKIYHVPGGEFYAGTTINPTYGERWFCTEAEARANGWRRSQQ